MDTTYDGITHPTNGLRICTYITTYHILDTFMSENWISDLILLINTDWLCNWQEGILRPSESSSAEKLHWFNAFLTLKLLHLELGVVFDTISERKEPKEGLYFPSLWFVIAIAPFQHQWDLFQIRKQTVLPILDNHDQINPAR